jgi:hypothetical protein
MNESNDNQDHELVKKHEVSSIDSTQNEDSLNAHTQEIYWNDQSNFSYYLLLIKIMPLKFD